MPSSGALSKLFGEPIAIVGAGCRLPGAPSPRAFWGRLVGNQSMTLRGADAAHYVKNITSFDSDVFGFNRSEASIMDPQQRIFLETAYEALQDANVPFTSTNVAVFSTVSLNTYLQRNLREQFGSDAQNSPANFLRMLLSNDKDYASTRLSHVLDLRGPSMTVQSACSSSLAAVMLACDALHSGRAEAAVVGGSSIAFPLDRYANFNEDREDLNLHNLFSGDGCCRSFDQNATGTSPGTGAVSLVLKPLSAALRDEDHVMACIVGAAANNDGSRKASFTGVCVEGQVDLLNAAYASAGITPRMAADNLAAIEAHGTGTVLGDPVEVAALRNMLQPDGGSHVGAPQIAIGSVKSNAGHLDTASGMAGLLKLAMSMSRSTIPASLHFDKASPAVEASLSEGGMFVNSRNRSWPADRSLAGISSFGMGGTNVHLVLRDVRSLVPTQPVAEQHPVCGLVASERGKSRTRSVTFTAAARLFTVSAHSHSRLAGACRSFAAYARTESQVARSMHVEGRLVASASKTTHLARRRHPARVAFVASTLAEVAQAATELAAESASRPAVKGGVSPPAVVFMFPGQGTQHLGMARNLYMQEPFFREQMAIVAEEAQNLGADFDILHSLFNDPGLEERQLNATSFAQVALFAVSYCMSRLFIHIGVQPDALIGWLGWLVGWLVVW